MRPWLAVAAALAAFLAGAAVWGWIPLAPAPAPRDIVAQPLDTLPGRPLRLLYLGTSLTAGSDWPAEVTRRLGQRLEAPPEVSVIAAPGEGSAWGLTQRDRIAATAADLVVIEFTANDADLRDGVSVTAGLAQHEALIETVFVANPEARVLLLASPPSFGMRGLIRTAQPRHLAGYRDLARRDPRLGYVDLRARWRARLAGTPPRRVLPDGLHPREVEMLQVIPGPVAAALTGLLPEGGGS